mmetsp:Transcript_24348/g.70217  ORF Transcript_24348/g.70217 Transcript_24348/m.70217 type:complete len:308 (-) Transcript_24348:290-1213(-)
MGLPHTSLPTEARQCTQPINKRYTPIYPRALHNVRNVHQRHSHVSQCGPATDKAPSIIKSRPLLLGQSGVDVFNHQGHISECVDHIMSTRLANKLVAARLLSARLFLLSECLPLVDRVHVHVCAVAAHSDRPASCVQALRNAHDAVVDFHDTLHIGYLEVSHVLVDHERLCPRPKAALQVVTRHERVAHEPLGGRLLERCIQQRTTQTSGACNLASHLPDLLDGVDALGHQGRISRHHVALSADKCLMQHFHIRRVRLVAPRLHEPTAHLHASIAMDRHNHTHNLLLARRWCAPPGFRGWPVCGSSS